MKREARYLVLYICLLYVVLAGSVWAFGLERGVLAFIGFDVITGIVIIGLMITHKGGDNGNDDPPIY